MTVCPVKSGNIRVYMLYMCMFADVVHQISVFSTTHSLLNNKLS